MKRYVGNLDVTKENQYQFKDLVEVTGYVSVSGEAKLDALQTVGGSVYVSGEAKLDAPNLKEKNLPQEDANKLRAEIRKINQENFERQGYLFADGILEHIVSKKTINNLVLYTTRKIAKDDISYCVFRGLI